MRYSNLAPLAMTSKFTRIHHGKWPVSEGTLGLNQPFLGPNSSEWSPVMGKFMSPTSRSGPLLEGKGMPWRSPQGVSMLIGRSHVCGWEKPFLGGRSHLGGRVKLLLGG